MYETFFGLKEMPFSVMPDPRFAYRSLGHKIAEGRMRFAADYKSGLAVLTGPIGCGKCLAPGTLVLMYDGRVKPVEVVRRGDLLMGPDSRPRRVLSTTNGFDRMYRVRPVKGDPYVVNEPHILSLRYTRGLGMKSGQIVNISVRDYLSRSDAFKATTKGWRAAVNWPEQPVALEAYFLGLWLGDGSADGSADGPRISTTDVPVVDYLEEFAERACAQVRRVVIKGDCCPAYDITTGRCATQKFGFGQNPVRNALRDYGLIGDKHIPHVYKANSRQVRLELLAGLIDSDGHLHGNTYDLVFKSESLAADVAFVAQSLGFAASLTLCRKVCTNSVKASSRLNGRPGAYWRICISGDTEAIPVRLARKRATPRRQKKDVLRTGIAAVEPVGTGIYFGFELDGDGLFLLGDFTVTHNTTIANMLVADWADDTSKRVAYLPTADDRGRSAFIRRVMDGFGVTTERAFRNYADNRDALERFLLDEHEAGRHAVLVIDEAQKIHPDNFDTLTDLTNFQTATEKFLTIILFAQDNFSNKLRLKDAFTSRIAFTGHLDPLSPEDLRGMIAYRLTVGGAQIRTRRPARKGEEPAPDLSPFLTDDALVEVFKITKGVPRDVCIFLSALFLDAYVRDEKPVGCETVKATLAEMSRMKKWPVQIKETK